MLGVGFVKNLYEAVRSILAQGVGAIVGSRLTATSGGTAGAPAFALGDGDSGFYEVVDDFLVMSSAGIAYQQWVSNETQTLVKLTLANRFALGNVIASALTTSVNDHAPTGITACNGIRFTSDGAYNITGLQGGFTSGLLLLINASAFTLTLVHASGSSSPGNKFACPSGANFSLVAGACRWIWYDAADLSWRIC